MRTIAEGSAWTLGLDVSLAVLLPPAAVRAGAKDNERSVVLAVASGGRRLLLTGDLEGVGLLELVAKPAPAVDAFLAPHHGGRASNPPWLYDWARPGLVVASQRRPPGRDALDAVAGRGIPVLRTWERGAVRLRWTDGGLAAEGFLDDLSPARSPMTLAASPTLVAVACLLAGLLAAALLAVVEFGAWILVTPGRSLALPADDPYPGEPIHVEAGDGVRLAGTWHGHPDAKGRTLLLLHGLAEGRQMMRARADGVYARGWNVAVSSTPGAYGDGGGGHGGPRSAVARPMTSGPGSTRSPPGSAPGCGWRPGAARWAPRRRPPRAADDARLRGPGPWRPPTSTCTGRPRP